ncbi:ABC-type branched-subunit amino acid transport system ATPase component [Bradyrhizobium sp. i1.7.7]
MTIALETQNLEKQFGGLRVTRDLSLKIEQGARHALIGPNGAGKTTVINQLTGVLKPNSGRILLEGQDITDLPVHKRVLRGLSRTFQINQLYPDLTPLETIGLAVSERLGHGGDWWRRMGTRGDVNGEIADLLRRFHLLDVMNEETVTLPYGKQRLLEIAVAIAAKPRVLLLDEPAAGVPESERHDILAVVGQPAARRHRAPDRARHGPCLFLRRPHLGIGLGRAAHRRSARRGRARPAGQGRLSRRGGGQCLTCSRSTHFAPAMARRWCCPTCLCASPRGRCLRCWAATGPARPR